MAASRQSRMPVLPWAKTLPPATVGVARGPSPPMLLESTKRTGLSCDQTGSPVLAVPRNDQLVVAALLLRDRQVAGHGEGAPAGADLLPPNLARRMGGPVGVEIDAVYDRVTMRAEELGEVARPERRVAPRRTALMDSFASAVVGRLPPAQAEMQPHVAGGAIDLEQSEKRDDAKHRQPADGQPDPPRPAAEEHEPRSQEEQVRPQAAWVERLRMAASSGQRPEADEGEQPAHQHQDRRLASTSATCGAAARRGERRGSSPPLRPAGW